MVTVTPDEFRASLSAFADPTYYPDGDVQFWLTIAGNLVNPDRWGDLAPFGVMLATAHYLTMAGLSRMEAEAGGIGGLRAGPIASEHGDKVGVSFDTQSAVEEGAGHWNMTTWGKQYIALARLHGAGPVQIGVPAVGDIPAYTGSGWPGFIY